MGLRACERTTMPTTTAPMCMMRQVTISRLYVINHERGVGNNYMYMYTALKAVAVTVS